VTIKGFKLLGADSKISTLNKLRCALEIAGVELIDADCPVCDSGARRESGEEGKRVASQLTHADRIERSLKRFGFRLSRTGRTFRITDTAGALAVKSKPGMSLAEIEIWISDILRPGGKRR